MNKATAQTVQLRNGVDMIALAGTIEAVRKQPSLGTFRFRASNRWIDGGRNQSTIQGFYGCGTEDASRTAPFVLDADEPPVLLGADTGANPVEYILHALAACLTTTMAYHAAARGIEIGSIESELEGDLDLRGFLGLSETVRKGYSAIRVRMRVAADADPEVLAGLACYSPVYDVVSRAVPVDLRIERC